MSAARFLIFKFIPDMHRFEPRNIGVLVWAECGVAAKFIGEQSALVGGIDGRSIPHFVANSGAYKQWIAFWRSQINAEEIEPVTGGRLVSKTSPDYLDVLTSTGSGDFLVSDGGILLDEVTRDNINFIADDMYEQLVAPMATSVAALVEEQRDPALDEICDELIHESPLSGDPNFKKDGYTISCPIDSGGKLFEIFEFSHAYKNGDLRQLYQRVPLSKQRKSMRKTVHDSAWMFDKITSGKIVSPEQCACLVYVNEDRQRDPDVAHSLMVLGSVARVVNVADRKTALEDFRKVADAHTLH